MSNEYPFTHTVEVTFRDIDVLGHVNNAVYLTYMETARIKYLTQVLALKSLQEVPVILAEATCTYKSPAYYGEMLHIGVGVTRFGTKSCDMVYRVAAEDERLIALGRSVLVTFDYATGKTIGIPENVKSRILAFQNGWQLPSE